MTAHPPSTSSPATRFARLLASEVTKLATLPAVLWTLTAIGGVAVATAVLFASLYIDSSTAVSGTRDLLDIALRPIEYVQAGFLLLGILAITSEYPGTIRTT